MSQICVVSQLLAISHSVWIQSTSTIPWESSSFSLAFATYNHSIYLLNKYQLLEYDPHLSIFKDHGSNYFDTPYLSGWAQYYTQMQNKMYFVPLEVDEKKKQSYLYIFDLQSKTLIGQEETPGFILKGTACVASANGYIVITGGDYDSWGNTVNYVQMFDVQTNTWLNNVAYLTLPRADHACIMDHVTDILYVIGGDDGVSEYYKVIEKINVLSITQDVWSSAGMLITGVSFGRAVMYQDMILLIGGAVGVFEGETYRFFDMVQMMNPITGETSLFPDSLPYKMCGGAPVYLDDVLYVFGANNRSGYVRKWMIYDDSDSTTSTPNNNMVNITDIIQTTYLSTMSSTIDSATSSATSVDPQTSSTTHLTLNPTSYLTTYQSVDTITSTTDKSHKTTNEILSTSIASVPASIHSTQPIVVLDSTQYASDSSDHSRSDVSYVPKAYDFTIPIIVSVLTAIFISSVGGICLYFYWKQSEHNKDIELVNSKSISVDLYKMDVEQLDLEQKEPHAQIVEEPYTIEGEPNKHKDVEVAKTTGDELTDGAARI